MNIPTVCWSGGLIGAGIALGITYNHENTKVPSHCVAGSLAAVAGVTFGLAHHGDFSQMPPWYCTLGGAGALAAAGILAEKHGSDEGAKVPVKCVLGSLAGVALLTAGLSIGLKGACK